MATATAIEWVRGADGSKGLSWNALRAERAIVRRGETITVSAHHCEHVNEACRWCYADRTNARLGGLPFKPGHRKDYRFVIDHAKLAAPLRRRKPTRIFVESMSDAFGDWWPRAFVDQLYAVMALSPWHTYINLSKRPQRRKDYLDDPETARRIFAAADLIAFDLNLPGPFAAFDAAAGTVTLPLRNVLEGTSVSCQPEADEFVPILLATKAARRILSCEPLLGPIDLTNHCNGHYFFDSLRGTRWHDDPEHANPCEKYAPGLDGVIAGGESGPRARPMHPDWPRQLRDDCRAAAVAFFFKQWGNWAPVAEADALTGQQRSRAIDVAGNVPPGDPSTDAGCQQILSALHRGAYQYMAAVGKGKAGRLLDGVLHDGFPAVVA